MPDYSQFSGRPCPVAVRMEQHTTESGELKLTTEIMAPAGNDLIMIALRKGIQQLIKGLSGGGPPLFEEEYNLRENPDKYDEPIESYYARTAGEINGYDPKNFN